MSNNELLVTSGTRIKVGGGCRPTGINKIRRKPPIIDTQTPEEKAKADREWAELQKKWAKEAAQRQAAVKRIVEERERWEEASIEILTRGPKVGDVFSALPGEEPLFTTVCFDEKKGPTAYCLIRCTHPPEPPALPQWYLAGSGNKGLKVFLNRDGREKIWAAYPDIYKWGSGSCFLNVKVRIIGQSTSGKSLTGEIIA